MILGRGVFLEIGETRMQMMDIDIRDLESRCVSRNGMGVVKGSCDFLRVMKGGDFWIIRKTWMIGKFG